MPVITKMETSFSMLSQDINAHEILTKLGVKYLVLVEYPRNFVQVHIFTNLTLTTRNTVKIVLFSLHVNLPLWQPQLVPWSFQNI